MDIVVFGLANTSSVVWHLLTHAGGFRVVGFTVDAAYRSTDVFHELPVVDFERVEAVFPPGDCRMLIPIGWKEMNRLRMRKVAQAQAKGYELIAFAADGAIVPPDLELRPNTILYPGVEIAPFAQILENCSIRTGSIVCHHGRIDAHCLIGPGVTIAGNVHIGEQSVIGAGAVIRDGIAVAPGCFIGAGAVVVANTRENGFYVGLPARLQPTPADQLKEVL